ncbi:hypothetical protein BDN72DRAFT_197790 [Pluteus cervinus]|uniref:Uncharacterized protein n=1 Tax=Pluteus cervinus TaxID=181527 RepID=A0ACD3B689_9AGAR|nr:hypothetical protein BDN72DRAFT_197790 [Pluteus cervinus]
MQPPEHNPWEDGIKLAKDFDNEMCDRLKEEHENILLFAALFSAIVTAFAVVSYQWLQPNTASTPPPIPHHLAVWINFLWFMSLTMSLSVSCIGILCMQWVRHYRAWRPTMSRHAAALRRQRYEGFLLWRIPGIGAALLFMLQVALILFVIGLNFLMWSLDRIVASGVAAVSSCLFSFMILTMLAPAFQRWFKPPFSVMASLCPYQSPQSWIIYFLGWALVSIFSGKMQDWDRNWEAFNESWMKLNVTETSPPLDYESQFTKSNSKETSPPLTTSPNSFFVNSPG